MIAAAILHEPQRLRHVGILEHLTMAQVGVPALAGKPAKDRPKAGLQRRLGAPGGLSGECRSIHGQQTVRATQPQVGVPPLGGLGYGSE